MTAPASRIEQHPDLVEMRDRYDRAAAAPSAQVLEGLTFLAGIYIAISPWVVGFNDVSTPLAVSNLVVGLAFAVLAFGLSSAYGRTHPLAWTAPLLGAWVIISQWVIAGAPTSTSVVLTNVIAGGVAALCGLAMMGLSVTGKSKGDGGGRGRAETQR
ncbi:SPW repeat protein [Streptomyces oceani]|uniref:SPW repeat-containing integral membrane domain-containing protein n=1 Tax=Streptomyces oceani TaxID=1075402 RepID=A0A1E7JVW2_9ACTN|nr:SPW repeat protein [Streptomyces oceani]OEU94810.1 hypothetical protein AN216_23940 [Streptomyces oceani]